MTLNSINQPQDIAFIYPVKGAKCVLSGRVLNGGASVTKAFVAVFKFFTKEGELLDGPYAGLHESRLGHYKYIEGGSAAAQRAFSIKIGVPKKAAKVSVTFSPWESKDPILFLSYPALELHSAGKKAAA